MWKKRAEYLARMNEITAGFEAGGEVTDDLLAELKDLKAKVAALNTAISEAAHVNGLTTEAASQVEPPVDAGALTGIKTAGTKKPEDHKPNVEVVSNNREHLPYANFGEQVVAVYKAAKYQQRDDRLDVILKAAAQGQNTINPSEGGYLVQSDFASTIKEHAYAASALASRCTPITIGEGKNGLSLPEIQDYDHSGGSVAAGILGYWMDEAGQFTKTKVTLKMLETKLRKIGCLGYFTDEQAEDAPALGQWLMKGMSKQIAYQLDKAILFGDGATQPLGILNTANASLLAVAKKTGQTAATFVFENANKMNSRLNPSSDESGSPVWVCGVDVSEQLPLMTLVGGTAAVPVFMPNTGIVGRGFGTMYGKPVIKSGVMKALGTQGDILLADFSEYLLIDKGSPKMATSIHIRFEYGEQAIRLDYRVGGQPLWSAKLKLESTIEVSPFVALQVRA